MEWYSQTIKRLPTTRETWVQSLGREDLLEKEMAIHSSILAWKMPWTEKPGKIQSTGSQRVRRDWATSLFFIHAHAHTHTQTHTKFLDWKNQYCENDHITQSKLLIQWNPYQITNDIFHRLEEKILHWHKNMKDPQIANRIFRKEK